MAVNQYLPWATGGGANVEDPATYAADAQRGLGVQAGVARSSMANTAWRQASVAVAALAQKIVDVTGLDMLDDGSIPNFEAGITSMLNLLGGLGSGGIFGLTMSNAAGALTTKVTIQAGQCRDSLNSANIILPAPFTKDLTAVWAAGDGNGGRDLATALAAGQTWHMFLIFKPSTNTVDALFSQSPTAPTMPALFTKFRRVGSVMLDPAATTIRQFLQVGDWFMWKTRSADFAAQANGGGVAYLRVITVPNGIKVEAKMYFQSTGTANVYLSGIFDPDFGVPVAFGGPTQWAQVRRAAYLDPTSTPISYDTVMVTQFTDSSQHVYTFSNDPSDIIALGVVGYRDERGKFF